MIMIVEELETIYTDWKHQRCEPRKAIKQFITEFLLLKIPIKCSNAICLTPNAIARA